MTERERPRRAPSDRSALALCPSCYRTAPWGHFRLEAAMVGDWLCPRCWAAAAWGTDPLGDEPRARGPAPDWEFLWGLRP